MPKVTYKNCRECGKHSTEVGPLSHTRLCRPCGERIAEENYDALTTRSGPFFGHWRQRTAASVGAVLLDDVRTQT